MGDAEDVPDAFAGGRLSTLVQSTDSVVSAVSVAFSSSMVPFGRQGVVPAFPEVVSEISGAASVYLK